MKTLSDILDNIVIGLPLVVVSRLWYLKMLSRYRWFLWMLVIEVCRDVLLRLIKRDDTGPYDNAWLLSLFPWALSQIAAVVAAYDDLATLYTGAARFLGWICLSAIGIGLCVSFGVDHQVQSSLLGFKPWTEIGVRLEQSFALVMLVAMALIRLILVYFPEPLEKMPRNIKAHLLILAVYFLNTAGLDLAATLLFGTYSERSYLNVCQTVSQGVFCLCYLAWATLISKSGNESTNWPDLRPEFKERLHRAHGRILRITRKDLAARSLRKPVD